MKHWLVLTISVLFGCLLLFGRSCFGGHFIVDPTYGMDVYHLSVLYERFGVHVAEGSFPFYFPEFACGYPVASTWMYGLFYPPTLLFALLPADLAWTASTVLHLLFGALGMFVLVRRRLESGPGAVTAALVYTFSEFMIGRAIGGHLNLVWPAAWVPWVLWAAGRAVRRERAGIPVLGLTLGLGLLSGHVQIWIYAGPVIALYSVAIALRGRGRGAALAAVCVGVLLATGIAAVQWISTAELIEVTGSPEVDDEQLLDFASPSHVLASKAFPGYLGHLPGEEAGGTYWGGRRFAHESVAIGGLAVLFLATLGVVSKRRGRWLWLGVALAGLLLAPGKHNPLSGFLSDLPVLSLGRSASRALFLTVLGTSVLAGRGVAAWLDRDRPLARGRVAAAAVVAGALGILALAGLLLWQRGETDPIPGGVPLLAVAKSAAGLGILAGGLLLVRVRPRLRQSLPVLVLAVLLGTALPPVGTTASDFYFHDWSGDLPRSAREHRIHVELERFPSIERQGWRTLRLMSPADVPAYLEMLRSPYQSRLLHYWLDLGTFLDPVVRPELLEGAPLPRARVTKRQPACGRALFFPEARVSADDRETMRVLRTRQDLLLLSESPEGAPLSATERLRPEDRGTTIRARPQDDPNRLVIDVDTNVAGWLYVSEKYYPAWRARVDGVQAPLVRANVFGLAVPVPAGESEVEVEFSTAGRRYGVPLSLLSLAVCGLLLFLALRRRVRAGD